MEKTRTIAQPRRQSTARSHRAASLSVLAGALCLSASAVLVKLAGVDPSTTAVLRCAIACAFLVPLALWERRRRGAPSRTATLWAIVAGIALGVDYAAWTASIYHVGAGISTVLVNVQVIVLPALAFAFDGERPPRRFLLAVPAMGAGIVMVGGIGAGAETDGDRVVSGTVLGVLAGVGYAVYLYLTRRGNRASPGRTVQSLAWATLSAATTAALLAPFGSGLDITGISARSWLLLLLLAVLGQVIAWMFINTGSAELAPSTTAALLLVHPILALALAAAVLAERPQPTQLVGAVLVVTGVAVAGNAVPGAVALLPRGKRGAGR
ncbi:DMT family transporter [Promicromonospora sp. NPDC023987]|uniref:DMT family transporter n=1 Tax=Promicromonospora sp. NPDC023987 TaxID=3155360 RepID=UPI003401F566